MVEIVRAPEPLKLAIHGVLAVGQNSCAGRLTLCYNHRQRSPLAFSRVVAPRG